MIKQKDAVFNAIEAATTQGLSGDAIQAFAVEQVKQGLLNGEVVHSKGTFTDPKKAESYARSLISNWKKKDERLNGGAKYVPTMKRGPIVKDETLRKLNDALKSLRVHNRPEDQDLIARVEAQVEARRAEVAATKAATKVQSLDETLASLQELGIDVA